MNDWLGYSIPFLSNIVRYFVIAGTPFLIFYILFPKKFATNKIQSRLAKKQDFRREILYSLQSTLIIVSILLAILKSPLKEYTQFYNNLSDYSIGWIPISILLSLVVHDTYFYWMHRLIHHPQLFKRIHLVHHKSSNPSPWASYSFHFIEAVLESLFAIIILFTIPMHPLSLVLFGLAAFSINVYGHLGFEIAPAWFRHSFLFEIFNSSVYHNIHHSKFSGNYGLYFRVWDRLMGTEHPDYVKEYDAIQMKRFPSS